jgi:hypothetical protein
MTTRHLARNDRETDDTGENRNREKIREKSETEKVYIVCEPSAGERKN